MQFAMLGGEIFLFVNLSKSDTHLFGQHYLVTKLKRLQVNFNENLTLSGKSLRGDDVREVDFASLHFFENMTNLK